MTSCPDDFYRRVLDDLAATGVPHLLGGMVALRHYAGIERETKDLDVFVEMPDAPALLAACAARGWDAGLVFPHWLGKIRDPDGGWTVDVIFGSGNGLALVDADWFRHAEVGTAVGRPVRICPVEETIWSKAFIMERERFDGADVLHLVRARGASLDWTRLLARFGPHGAVLLAHLVLYDYVYPAERDAVPDWVLDALLARWRQARATPPAVPRPCFGPFLSRAQYSQELQQGYADPRLPPTGCMSAADIARWDAGEE